MADQDDTIAALMHYVRHDTRCPHPIVYAWGRECTCGLADVLRGIDAKRAGRIVAPVSVSETTGDDDGN